MLHDRHWSRAEANAALERLAPRVRALRSRFEQLGSPEAKERFAEVAAVSGGGYPGHELARATVEDGLHQLSGEEIVVRDLERGLIDFPALIDGREVYLCWLCGEPEVSHWHDPEAGFSGRKPLR